MGIKMTSTERGAIIIVLAVIALIIVISLPSKDKDTNTVESIAVEKLRSLTQEQLNNILEWEKDGTVRIEAQANIVYIDPVTWLFLDAKEKENFGSLFATYFANKQGKNTYIAYVYDKQSGKKLAKYSSVFGFTVY